MTEHSGGDTTDQGGASKPTQEEQEAEFAGVAGNAADNGERPLTGNREPGAAGSADEPAPIDLDTAHDRAS